ncbi:MAG: bacillithiol biosynthesis cysteine-adding enzyme BshC [Chitinophagaceae bacterium]|nr:bacillithiol biosynthesis cysteine-adding enzyme BshC [Chitinophagaceae bacterium]
MSHHCIRLPYERTGYFSRIVTDYLQRSANLQNFYLHQPDLAGIRNAITARQAFPTPRPVLVAALQEQYAGLSMTDQVQDNIRALSDEQTFTVVTAHQPNIFTGPLYFIYKILHTIKLASWLSEQLPAQKFVPVYYMGSEDADLDELGHLSIDGNPLKWETGQTGAVGRMKVDKGLLKLLHTIEGQVGVLPYGAELVQLFKEAYTEGSLIQDATLKLVHALFGRYGLVVLIPDNAALKRSFQPVVTRELLEQFSHKAVQSTIQALGQHYKVQAAGRELNLFYLINDRRERIERNLQGFAVPALDLQFSKEAILQELETYPERFSANVILRGAFQETILPNIAFIGGGGELAYWLELKEVFATAGIPYPVLVLRNSFLTMTAAQEKRMQELGLLPETLFQPLHDIMNTLVRKRSGHQLSLTEEIKAIQDLYRHMNEAAGNIDTTLKAHVGALETAAVKRLEELEKKMLRAEKHRFEAEQRQLEKLKSNLFPNQSLQERTDNMSGWYGRWGKAWLDILLDHSLPLESAFTVMTLGE